MLARRIFADGRTRAYAWGRSAAREDVAAAAEALIAMSGQFEQRRLARPAYQRGVLDAFAGLDTRAARAPGVSCRLPGARYDELTRDAAAAQARLDELRRLPRTPRASRPAARTSCAPSASGCATSRELAEGVCGRGDAPSSPDEGEGATDLVARGRALRRTASSGSRRSSRPPGTRCARPSCSCARPRPTCARSSLRSRRSPAGSRSSRASSRAFSDLKRRYRAQTFAELLERGEEARRRARAALAEGHDPVRARPSALAAAQAEVDRLHAELRAARAARRRTRSRRPWRPSCRRSGSATVSSASC